MPNFVIVAETRSFYITVIRNKMEEKNYRCLVIRAETGEVYKLNASLEDGGGGDKIDGILLYADETLPDHHTALIALKDKAMEEDIPLFAIGSAGELNRLGNIIPKQIIRQSFTRPIDILNVVDEIDEYIGKHSRMKKILVVDDSGAALRNIKGWLEDEYNVFLANSGAMAIKYLSVNKPDLMLLDYEMPLCDGKQLLEMIRAEVEFEDVPVIFLTNKNSAENIMSVQPLKPDGYLLKSMETAKILEAIHEFFERRKGGSNITAQTRG
jgi:DNA-binding response OmpR family regulator